MTRCCSSKIQGGYKVLFLKFCDVAEMAMIDKTSQPNLAIKKMIGETLAFYTSGYEEDES